MVDQQVSDIMWLIKLQRYAHDESDQYGNGLAASVALQAQISTCAVGLFHCTSRARLLRLHIEILLYTALMFYRGFSYNSPNESQR